MQCPNGHNTNRTSGSRRSTTGGRRPAHRVQGSGGSIVNCKLATARPSPLAPLPKGEGTKGSGRCETASGFLHPSSFIHHPSSLIHHPSSFRRGVTLVEMLVVISIIVILTVASLKLITPGEERRVREAARAVNVYISSARSRAIEIGRPCGVIFRRASGTNFPSAAMILDQCEVPPPYAGDTTGAVVQVQTISASPPILHIQITPTDFSSGLIRPGDLMQLNNQGPLYTLNNGDYSLDANNFINFTSGTYLTLSLSTNEMPLQTLPWPVGTWSAPVSFQILRQPDQVRSSASTLQLPAGAVVDLNYSSTGLALASTYNSTTRRYTSNTYFLDDPTHPALMIIFSGNGAVEGYYLNGKHSVSGPIFLLIGQTKLIDPTSGGTDANGTDLSNIWVTINPQTGLVSTDEMAAGSDPLKYARQSQSMGGR
jgi:prepilin-type N-terminal cleavage/methylation domain-containing protein